MNDKILEVYKSSYLSSLREVAVINEELGYRINSKEITEQPATAVATKSFSGMKLYVQKCVALHIQGKTELLDEARKTLIHLEDVHFQIRHAIETKRQEDLEKAVEMCRLSQYSGNEVDRVVQLKDEVEFFNKEAAVALNVCDLNDLKRQLHLAKTLGLTENPLVNEIKLILFECDDIQQKRIQYMAAMELADIALIIDRQVAYYDCKLGASRDLLNWRRSPGLKSPSQWVASKWTGKAELKATFYRHSRSCIHESMTELKSDKLNKKALECFRSILTVMGDRIASNPMFEAKELLLKAYKYPSLKEEILLQLMKQLSNNPDPTSISKGWRLLALCLRTFRPGRLEDILFVFIKANCGNSDALAKLMYYSIMTSTNKKPTLAYVEALFK